MDVILDGVVLRGQAEGVEAHGEEDVVPIHPLFPGNNVHGGVGPGMAHMEPLPGGVGELDEAVELGLFALIGGGEDLAVLPALLPLGLDGSKIVFQNHHTLFVCCPGTFRQKFRTEGIISDFFLNCKGVSRHFPSRQSHRSRCSRTCFTIRMNPAAYWGRAPPLG